MGRHVAHTGERAEYEFTVSPSVDVIQILEPGDVNYLVWRLEIELHQIVERGAPRDEARPQPSARNAANGIFNSLRTRIAEGLHASSPPHLGRSILDRGDDADIGAA